MAVQFGVLGPLAVWSDGEPVDVKGAKRRGLLAYLLAHAGDPQPTARIVDALWGEHASPGSEATVQTYVSQLRKLFASDGPSLVYRAGGYVLELDAGALDTIRFEAAIATATGLADRDQRLPLLDEALRLWRGPPLDEFAGQQWADARARQWTRMHVLAHQLRAQALLDAGRHRDALPGLEQLVGLHPLHEPFWAQLIVARYRCGQQADALAAVSEARGVLATELGIAPGPELVELENRILAQDPSLAASVSETTINEPPGASRLEPLPDGVVTFLLTDIERSTELWDGQPADMANALLRHEDIIGEVVQSHHGHFLKSRGEGDATLSVFTKATDAVSAAVALQRRLQNEPWEGGLELWTRVAVHTGEAQLRTGDYYGGTLNRAARLRALASGGEVLVSHATHDVVVDTLGGELELVPVGEHTMRGLRRKEYVYAVRGPGLSESTSRDAFVNVQPVSFEVLGPLAVTRGGVPSHVRGGRRRALLLRLLVSANQFVDGDRLADDIWEGQPPAGAASTLASHVSLVRKLIGAERLESRAGAYRLIVRDGELDAECFLDDLDDGQRRFARGDPAGALAALDAALARWRGPALADAQGSAWAAGEITRLETAHVTALEARLESKLALGHHGDVIGEAEALLAAHPLYERTWAHLIVALYRAGRQADALAAYQRARRHLVEELGIEPGPELRALEAKVLRHDVSLQRTDVVTSAAPRPRAEPELVSGRPPPRLDRETDELPIERGELIGRDAIVDLVADAVRHARLVTLWGPGGVGKTRLAVGIAHAQRGLLRDGARFVDLAVLEPSSTITDVMLETLGVQSWADETPSAALVRALRSSETLLVMDNCEHVLGAVREIVHALLERCPDVHLLLTSREALGVAEEHRVAITPLAVPEQPLPALSELLATPSVRLFSARAVETDAAFTIDEDNAAAVATLIRYLGGLPLALELAAGRLDVESVPELAAGVETGAIARLEVRGGTKTGRAGSVTSSLSWSYDALSKSQQDLLASVSVFAGQFTRGMALAVHGDDSPAVHRDFDQLVRAALVSRDAAATARFRLLEPVRAFARDHLTDSKGLEVRARHAQEMLARAERLAPEVRTREQLQASAAFRADLADHRAAMRTLLDADEGNADDAAKLLVALFTFCHLHVVPEVNRWARQLADTLSEDHELLAETCGAAALGAWFEGRMDVAIDYGERSVRVANEQDRHASYWARLALVDAYGFLGSEAMYAHYFALVRESRDDPDPFWRINGMGYEAIGALITGRRERALEHADLALRESRQLGNPECLQWALHCFGRAIADVDPVGAAAAFEQAMAAVSSVEGRLGRALNLCEWVGVKRRVQAWDDAIRGLVDLLGLLRTTGIRSFLSAALREAAHVLQHYGDDDTAIAAILARSELPDMPVVTDEPPLLREELEAAAGERWPVLLMQARVRSADDVLELCLTSLGRIASSL
jgi:DNA-binding SARP family transcriptional activator/predicted ATPase